MEQLEHCILQITQMTGYINYTAYCHTSSTNAETTFPVPVLLWF